MLTNSWSLLVKANLSENSAQRLSDCELLDQLSTFLFAGSDTTAISISWALHYLSQNPELQFRLRQELSSVVIPSGASLDITVLDSLPFLDAVVKETLRLAPPVHGTIRVATKDDYIPLSSPTILRTNEEVSSIRIRKGSYIHIPIEGLNYSKDIWGPDALTFRPERWTMQSGSPGGVPAQHPGLANIMSFSFGPHACLGWRFSILEMKVFLAVLLPQFSFAPAAEISKYNAIITRPYVTNKYELGAQLPLKISRYTA